MPQDSLEESQFAEIHPKSGFMKFEYWVLMIFLAIGLISILLLCLRFLCCRKTNSSKTFEKSAEVKLMEVAETEEIKKEAASVCDLQSIFTEINENPKSDQSRKTEHQAKLRQTEIIYPNGGTYKVGCYEFHFPSGSVSRATEVHFIIGKVTKHSEKAFSIAPVLTCLPCGTTFKEKFRVSVKTSFFEATQMAVTAKVSVRDNDNSDWRDESTTALGKNGEVVFTADHFSDRAIEVDNSAVSAVGRSMATLGFVKNLHPGAKVLAWYVFDKLDVAYDRILKLHKREETAINYATFKVRLDRDLILELELPESRLDIDQPRTSFRSCRIRDEESHSSSIKISSVPESSHSIGYSIAQFAQGSYHQKVTGTLHMSFLALRDDVTERDSVVINAHDVIIADLVNQINSNSDNRGEQATVNRRSRVSDRTSVNQGSDDKWSVRPASHFSTSSGPRSRPNSVTSPYSTLGSRSEASGSSSRQNFQLLDKLRQLEDVNFSRASANPFMRK